MGEQTFIDIVLLLGVAVFLGTAALNHAIVKTIRRLRQKETIAAVGNIIMALVFLGLIVGCLLVVRKKTPSYAYSLAAVAYVFISVMTWRFWENDRTAFYIMVQLLYGYFLWAGLSIAFFVLTTYGVGLGLAVFVLFPIPPLWAMIGAYRTYQKYGTVEKRFISAVEVSGPKALVLHDPPFRLWHTLSERVPFTRRWWRVAVMVLVVAVLIAMVGKSWSSVGSLAAGLLLSAIAVEHGIRKRWMNGGVCFFNALVWIVFGIVTLLNPGESKPLVLWGLLGIVLTPTTFIMLLVDAITKRAV